MADIKKFITPRDTVFGRGSLAYLEKMPGKRALIITDKNMTRLGTAPKAQDYLKKAKIEVRMFDEVEPEPSITTVKKALEMYREFAPDLIVGLGGGSAIDASKCFRILFENPDLTFEEVRAFGGPPKKPIPPFKTTVHIGIPSTSGTGSEVSWGSIISDPAISAKCLIANTELIPNIAILDPDIADTMPKSVRADTGLDALTHAMEAYVSLQGNDFSRGCALQAISLLMQYLIPAYRDDDKEAKEHQHYAASIAANGFSNSGLGIDHVVAILIGNMFHFTHGRTCGILLPYVIKLNARAAGERYAELARAVGYNGSCIDEAVDYLVQKVIEVKRQLDSPGSYGEAGVSEGDYVAKIPKMIEMSFGHPAMMSNPLKCTAADIEKLCKACYYDTYDLG